MTARPTPGLRQPLAALLDALREYGEWLRGERERKTQAERQKTAPTCSSPPDSDHDTAK